MQIRLYSAPLYCRFIMELQPMPTGLFNYCTYSTLVFALSVRV